jgi:hypothetical protein
MHCEMNIIATVPVVWACRVYEDGKSMAAYDGYFNACVAVVGEDGIPEVELFAIPMEDEKDKPDAKRLAKQRCREVRQAMGRAFAAHGFTQYKRRHPHTGVLTVRSVLGDECDTEHKGT